MNLELMEYKSIEDLWTDFQKYTKTWDLDGEPMIKKAFDMAVLAHSGQTRESGEPFVTHPIWVAKVVTQLGVGRRAIIAALLHDIAEDTQINIDQIANDFDEEVALLVESLTEVKQRTKNIEVHETNIDVFRKFLFSSVDDVRVLIIRIVDKLHNGLTIGSLPKDRQVKYAQRIFGIYSPVAEYVGLHYFKQLLDDIAFKILYPPEAEELSKELKEFEKEEVKAKVIIEKEIESTLKINNIKDFEISGRIKSLYSTFNKIKLKGKDRVKDRVGLRILVESVSDCYTVLGLLHSKYPYIPEEFNDYISNPKPNGYRSIQTTLKWKEKVTLEVQIRTKEMHEFDEFGPASHIAYKLSKNADNSVGYNWVKDLVEWQKGDKNVNNYRINVLEKFIYVFTPKGDTIQMKVGSTALDFAYRVHGEIGNHCVGAKINNKMGKIDSVLKTGDYVEILTSKKMQRKRTQSP
ncbi:MAG: HD domain-containing protein [Candidatus Shapirobacteria bacterium]|nr:HD domain-containing protein [Candidatus Shapirobacteria bacterium]